VIRTEGGANPDSDLGRDRLLAFSDAIFAFAITLLALDVRLPDLPDSTTNAQLIDALIQLGPKIGAYAVTFAVVGLFWLAHWRRFQFIARVDEPLLLVNLVLLGFVALLPFPTAVLGTHGDLPAATVLYVVNLSIVGLLGTASWLVAVRRGLVRPDVTRSDELLGLLRGVPVPIVMLASLALLRFGTTVVELSWLLIFPVQSLIRRWVQSREGASQAT
jgi:uncharacterized membrane protein